MSGCAQLWVSVSPRTHQPVWIEHVEHMLAPAGDGEGREQIQEVAGPGEQHLWHFARLSFGSGSGDGRGVREEGYLWHSPLALACFGELAQSSRPKRVGVGEAKKG